MIQVFTLDKPNPKIKELAKEIFALPKGAYNLPLAHHHPQKELMDKLYKLGARQIIHDGKPDEIQCMDGHHYAVNLVTGEKMPDTDILVIKPSN